MKKLLLLICLISFISHSQIVNIPDPVFKQELLNASPDNNMAKDLNGNYFTIDSNNDGEIQVTEAEQVSYFSTGFNNLSDLTGIEMFINLDFFNCTNTNLTSIDLSQNYNLEFLSLTHNPLTNIDLSQNIQLRELYLDGNNLSSLDISNNTNLIALGVNGVGLTAIDLSQNILLERLRLDYNQFSSLDISSNINLKEFRCDHNQLTSLDVSQNINLESLNISENYTITNIDLSQNTLLESFDGATNQISNLDVSNNTLLERLTINDNNLNTIDLSNNPLLDRLTISNNGINNLDLSNNPLLYGLHCSSTNLTTLDLSNNMNLSFVICNDSNIQTVFAKNGRNQYLELNNCPDLTYICVDESEINNILGLVPSNVVVNTYCSFNPGGDHNVIEGYINFDLADNDCISGNIPIGNARVEINNGTETGVTYTNSLGKYIFFTGSGNFTVAPKLETSSCHENYSQSYSVSFPDDQNNLYTEDLCVTPVPGCDDVEIHIVPMGQAEPGFDADYGIIYKNKGSDVASGNIELIFDDDVLDYVSSSVPIASQTVGSLFWDYSDLLPFETRSFMVTLNLNSPMEDPPVNIDHELDFEAIIEPIPGDYTPADNVSILKQIVVGSFDPNDITCLEGAIVDPDMIGEYLHYNIRFENTGTAAATFVVITNELDDTQFDLSTLQVLNASHEMTARLVGNKLEVVFDDIDLEPLEQGNVLYKIKTRDNLNIGDSVEQQANIYFDYNFPIITNIATTTFETLSIEEFNNNTSVQVFPNPVSDQLTIKANAQIELVKLYDIHGRVTLSESHSAYEITLDVSSLSEGVYFIEIANSSGTNIEKLIKN